MANATRVSSALLTAACALGLFGCGEEGSGSGATTTQSAKATVAATTTAAATATATATATAAPTAEPKATRPCPPNSTGDGTSKSPCDAKGKERMMEVKWTGKTPDAGPSFNVQNKSKDLTILFGKIVVYFYDKAGKQLEVKDTAGKTHPHQACTGNLFSGIMKPQEKAVITFSCIKKDTVPEGTAAIEGEMQMVGFADDTEKKSDLFWRNNDLTPDARPKGGIK